MDRCNGQKLPRTVARMAAYRLAAMRVHAAATRVAVRILHVARKPGATQGNAVNTRSSLVTRRLRSQLRLARSGKGGARSSRTLGMTARAEAAPAQEAGLRDSDAVVRHLGSVINWARLRSFDLIHRRAGVEVDRSGIIILATLDRLGPMRMSDLAAEIGLDRSTISRQVAAVVRNGYVQKLDDSSDARASQLQLTSRGHAARRKLAEAWHDIVTELLAEWSSEEQAQLGRLLGKLAQQMRASAN
jgi:DNA-binding MarR family transcriptional regulator